MTEIKITMNVDETELWSAIFGSGWESFSWWANYEYMEGDWDEPGKVKIVADNPEEGPEYVTKELAMPEILEAWQKLLSKEGGYWHCGMRITGDTDEFDACAGDALLQMAMFGEVVYG